MADKLAVIVLGHRSAGKSTTWYTLFGRTVRTGEHELYLTEREYVEVFLVNGSPQERDKFIGDMMPVENPRIVLCSLQYKDDVMDSFDYFTKRGYLLFIHWLNPGYSDNGNNADSLGLVPRLLEAESLLGKRNGKVDATRRVSEMRDFIYGWAKARRLLLKGE